MLAPRYHNSAVINHSPDCGKVVASQGGWGSTLLVWPLLLLLLLLLLFLLLLLLLLHTHSRSPDTVCFAPGWWQLHVFTSGTTTNNNTSSRLFSKFLVTSSTCLPGDGPGHRPSDHHGGRGQAGGRTQGHSHLSS